MEHSKRHISPFWNFTSAIKDVFWIKDCTLQTLIPESFKNSILAGLLTYSIFLTPFPSLQSETVDLSIVGKLLAELTAAGLFRICTWFPFSSLISNRTGRGETKTGTKITKTIRFANTPDNFCYLCPRIGSGCMFPSSGLKGNRV